MRIRKFQPKDLEALLELFYHSVHSLGGTYYSEKQLQAWAPSLEVLDRDEWLNSLTKNTTFIAEEKGHMIGFGDMTREGHIERLYVHKDYEGKGVAFALYKKLEDEGRRLGLSELTLEASIFAKRFAERQGFVLIREHRKIHRGVEFVNYWMQKKI